MRLRSILKRAIILSPLALGFDTTRAEDWPEFLG